MRFYIHKANDTFEQFKAKVEIVEQLLSPPVSLSLIESNYPQDALGKRAAREIVQSTTSSIVIIIVLATIWFAISHELSAHPATSLVAFAGYIVMVGFCKWRLGSKKFDSDYQTKYPEVERIRQSFIAKHSGTDVEAVNAINNFFTLDVSPTKDKLIDIHRRRFALVLASQTKEGLYTDRVLTNVPFSLRNIWLWTLIIGLCTLFANKKYQIVRGLPFNEANFQDFVTDLLRILLIGVVAYIATNVIHELLQLREQYVQGRGEMASLNASIEKSTKDFEQIKTGFDQITDDAKKITDTLFLMSETAEVQNALIKLWRNFSVGQNPQPLEKIFKDFLDTIKRQFEIFNSKVTQNDVVNMWMLSSLNQYFKIASKEFEERCWVTTRFQFFGKIIDATISPILNSKPFLNDFKEKYEIFTVLVLPPKRFFNYNAGELSDPDWDEYIDINVEAKTKGLTINRHFLSLDFGENADELVKEEFGDESIELKKKEFKDQLNVEYWFSKSQSGKGSELIKRGKDKDNKDTYLKAEGASLEGYTKTPLWRILEEIHCDKACKVIELKIPSFDKNNSDPLLKFNDILWDSTTEKTIDYFAIRERETGSWVLCYRTVYDKTFDFAEIEILYEQSCAHDRWNMVCNNLNRVFLIGKTSSAANDVSRDEELGITISPIGAYINGGEVGNEGE